MVKRCIVCREEAVYKIKDTSDYYCGECAEEHFGDVEMLIKVEEEARKLKEVVAQKLQKELENE